MSAFKKPWERQERGGGFRKDGASGFGRKPSGFKKASGFKKPWERRDDDERGDREESRGFGRDDGRRFGGDRGFDRGERPFRKASGFKKPWERRDDDERGDRGESRGFGRDNGRRFGGDGGFDRGERPFRKASGFKKPWERRDDDEHGDRGSGGFRNTRGDRPFRPARSSEGFEGSFSRKPWRDRPTSPAAPRKPRPSPLPADGELLYGRQPVREILRSGRRPVNLVVFSDGVKDSDEVSEIKTLCESAAVRIEYRKREEIEAWTSGANHQGVVAFCADFPYSELDEIADALAAAPGNATVVVLDHVQDPQNLGSILRTCECAGVVGVVLPLARAVAVTPAAVRASAGASEHLRIARVSNLVTALERFKGAGAWITGLEAVPEARPCTKVDFKGKVCLVIGSESHGICSPVRKLCDFMVRLPLRGSVNSLNAGVATALALYEILRQHGAYDDPSSFPEPVVPSVDQVEPVDSAESVDSGDQVEPVDSAESVDSGDQVEQVDSADLVEPSAPDESVP